MEKRIRALHYVLYCEASLLMVDMYLHFYQISQFLIRQKHSKKYVLVHCTHGHNRTGFMIVHYLMRTLSISVTQVGVICGCFVICCLVLEKPFISEIIFFI